MDGTSKQKVDESLYMDKEVAFGGDGNQSSVLSKSYHPGEKLARISGKRHTLFKPQFRRFEHTIIPENRAVSLREETRRERPAHARVVTHDVDVRPVTRDVVTQQGAVSRIIVDEQ